MAIHEPVLLQTVLELLEPRPGARYLDGTIGLGGHAEAILERTGGRAHLVGIDRDEAALEHCRRRLERFGDAVTFERGNFADAARIALPPFDGILLDLGVSSLQLDDPARGFSFRGEGPIDMRMSRAQGRTAADLLRSLSEPELERILREYGEEPRARRIARAIVERRAAGWTSTKDLGDFLARVVRRSGRIHPATRAFQALRIAVNDEVENLKKFLDQFDSLLGEGGRIVVISFHSLEDRLVKYAFREGEREGRIELLTRKPICPSREETARNPRARSGKLRAAVRRETQSDRRVL